MSAPNTHCPDHAPGSTRGDQREALVVIPTYNEAENIEPVVERTLAAVPDADVLIVDDNSPDGTGEIGDRLSARRPEVHVLHRSSKDGLGAAYKHGFDWALRRRYPAVVEMDADGSHQPEQLPQLLAALDDGADLALGSRWMPGGRVENWSRFREWLSRGGNAYVRRVLGLPLCDATGGFRAFRSRALRSISLESVDSRGYCFQVDLAHRVVERGMRTTEVPIVFRERERGDSKMTASVAAESLWRVTVWSCTRPTGRIRRAVTPATA